MMFGRQLNNILDNARPSTRKRVHYQEVKANLLGDQMALNYQPGANVLVRTKEEAKWKPAIIEKRTHKYSYIIRTPDGILKRRHAVHISPSDIQQTPQSTPCQTPGTSSETPNAPVTIAPPERATSTIREHPEQPTTTPATSCKSAMGFRTSMRITKPPRRLIEEM